MGGHRFFSFRVSLARMCIKYVYYVLWLFAHTVAALITRTRDVYLLVHNRLKRAYSHTTRRWKRNVFEDCAKLKKLPQHLTVLLPIESCSNLDILVEIVLWSMYSNISYVSFYDALGHVAKKEDELIDRIKGRLAPGQHVIWHGKNQSVKNGFMQPKIHVKVFSDGRASLVDCCKELARGDEIITVESIAKHQRRSYEFPDPQLAIYSGKYFNLRGYPPWQIRLTEFINVERFEDIDAEGFVNVLRRYSRCQQRVGK